ncbi:MAG: proton-conducting transporter membrane subunit, partial [Myxococcota bacterium]
MLDGFGGSPWSGGLDVELLGAAILRLDAVSVTMLALVGFVGAVVLRFSARYLEGDPRQREFYVSLGLTLAAVTVLVTAGHVIVLLVGWVSTSLALHRLLVFYEHRPRAQAAASKKFWFARLGDLAVLGAVVLMVKETGTGRISAIAERASDELWLAAVLLAIAAMLKSAQFPTHGWLTEVMETPTPVSALLHAGIVNAGGFLIIRFAPVVAASQFALSLLVVVGILSAIFGSLAMMTEPRVKVSL